MREIDARRMPGTRAARCLIFESQLVVRRLWSYPAAWAALDDWTLLGVAELAPRAP